MTRYLLPKTKLSIAEMVYGIYYRQPVKDEV